jgi:hypothetical protein
MRIFWLLFALLFSASVFAQNADNTWKTLGKITFKKKYDEFMGFDVDVPVYGKEVKDLENKEITISGYIVPVEGYKEQNRFVLSAFPYNMCFFCGKAGPETVIEVNTKDKKGIAFTSKPITIKGVLALNTGGDINQLIYSLYYAEQVD